MGGTFYYRHSLGQRRDKKISKPWPKLGPNLRKQIDHEQYEKSLVFAVAEAEDHIASYIRIILRAHPDRLTRGSSGGLSARSVPLIDIIRMERKDLINSLIEDRVNSIMRDHALVQGPLGVSPGAG